MGAAPTRNFRRPRVANLRATLGPLVRDGKHEEADQVRRELAEEKFFTDIERAVDVYVAKKGCPLTEAEIDSIAAHLGGA